MLTKWGERDIVSNVAALIAKQRTWSLKTKQLNTQPKSIKKTKVILV